jgi:pyruvate formate lyase activating enzyme
MIKNNFMFSFFKKRKKEKKDKQAFKESDFYQKLSGDYVTCRLCSFFCKIEKGSRGICKVRANMDGKLYSLNYGKLSAVNIDPIEKKPLFHFYPGTKTFSIGTFGCNFSCQNCQNYSISQVEKDQILATPSYQAKDIVSEAIKNNCPSISYTYNEPTLMSEFCIEIMKEAKKKGLKNIFVSNGYMSKIFLKEILPYLDAINIDLKSSSEDFYLKICGAHLSPILSNMKDIKKAGVHVEITTLIIPELSDSKEELEKIALFILKNLGPSVPWHISAFSPEISWKLKEIPKTSFKKIEEVYKIAKESGLKHVYSGNIESKTMENTYCPNCGTLNIKRNDYKISRLDKNGKCHKCETGLELII